MSENGILDRNLLALSARHPELAQKLSSASSYPDLEIIESRKGPPVPVLRRDGRPFPMHSRFDPEAEGGRLADSAPEGFLIAFGLGGAYHLKPLLKKRTMTGLLIVEKDLSLLRGILEGIDLTRLFTDSRVLLIMNPSPDELIRFVLDRYLPVLYGNLGSLSLRSRFDADPEWFTERADALRGIPESLGRDYTVQTRFGRRWFVHTLANLPTSERTGAVLPPSERFIITAAGPSLHKQLPRIRALHRGGAVLLATDTSLPFLISEGETPDIVLSIDCQIVSYHHFLKGLPRKTLLLLDLASPPVLTRMTDRVLFFASGHPFSLYLNRLYRPFPILDLSGGNVTHAAVSLARAAGAGEIHLFGADFSYPMGRPYAKGTYLYPYFQSRSARTGGSEDSFWRFINSSRPRRESSGGSWRLRTASMDHYRESLEKTISSPDANVVQEDGDGVPLRTSGASRTHAPSSRGKFASLLSAGKASVGWKEFLKGYVGRLESLPPLNGPPQDYLADLCTEDRQAWATLLPSAATFRGNAEDGPKAVEEARKWTLDRIRTMRTRY